MLAPFTTLITDLAKDVPYANERGQSCLGIKSTLTTFNAFNESTIMERWSLSARVERPTLAAPMSICGLIKFYI